MTGYDQFQDYKNFICLNEDELKLANNYVCLNLNYSTRDYPYWYDMYSYLAKSFIVLRWRRENKKLPTAKLGEAVCMNKIVNFVNNEHKCTCSSVYFDAVKF